MSQGQWIGLWPQNPENLENTQFYPILNLIKNYLDLEELVDYENENGLFLVKL